LINLINLGNKKVFVDCEGNPDFKSGEYPDGMTIDKNGNLWVALYGGGRVVQINSETGIQLV
jgi:gluconolactonase